jgi:LPXTG-site transpeptidase (sortase) family protein
VPAAPVVARSVPISLRIPAIGLQVSLSDLGLNSDGTVQVPTDIEQPGWFDLGPTPGQVGSAVILGHVDSYLGPAVFFQLPTLRVGDAVEVSLADGVDAHFMVDTVVMYPKDQFPTSLVYASHGYQALQLITCGGSFDPETGHYLSNVVVYSTLAWTTPGPSSVISSQHVGERA